MIVHRMRVIYMYVKLQLTLIVQTMVIVLVFNYNDPLHPGRRTVLDFQRESLPITWGDIQVPFLPQVGDMILIKGDDPDPWLAKVLTVQERSKTAKVWYYMKDVERPGENLYVPYCGTRQAQDVVSWDSILCHSSGEWRGDAWLSDM